MNTARPRAGIGPGSVLTTASGETVRLGAWRGEGSYARVYLGTLAGRDCAVKLAKTEVAGADRRLLGERGALEGVGHPRLVRLLDVGSAEGIPFNVLEWLEGEPLHDYTGARRRLPLRRALEVLDGVLEGLQYLHALGRRHGDVRPQNVMLVPVRGTVLTDPAPADDPPGTDTAVDLRAAGALLHGMLTGQTFGSAAPPLTTASGFGRGVVSWWEATRAATPPSARELLSELRALRRAL